MSDNKFIKHLRGEDTAKSVLEIKNQKTPTSFGNMPEGNTSNANDVYSDHRGDAAGVLKGTENWKLDDHILMETQTVYGDGRDFSNSTYEASGNGLWVDASCTFATPRRFAPNTKFVLKLCGHDLNTVVGDTIGFTLLVKFGTNNVISKVFNITEQAFDFCKEFVIDFGESNTSAIKVAAGSTMTVQLLCADPDASATIYNGMTVLTALQRRVDGDAVASDTKTFEELEAISDAHISNKNNPHEVTKAQVGLGNCDNTSDLDKPISTATQTALNGKVSTDGSSIMTGPLKMRASSSFQCAIAPFWDGVGFYKLNNDDSVTLIASIETPDGFVPWVTNTYNIGSSLKKWKNLYLAGKAYMSVINNGYDIAVPVTNSADTLALKSEVDLAANSGRMILDQGVWYAKMYAATVAPSAENGTNYADFSQVDGQGNPIIVTYNRVNGAWVQDQTITPPAEYDGYVSITSKIWDITEQDGQQGGRILWNHQSKEFTPYPQIISFENAALTGVPTAPLPTDASPNNQIATKEYVDSHSSTGGYHPGILSWEWDDHLRNDVQWLRADTFSWQSGAVYEAVYNHLADDLPAEVPTIELTDLTPYTRYVSGDDSGAAYPYCWRNGTTNRYTASETPSVGDYAYTASSGGLHVNINGIGSSLPIPETETISGITISFYTANDGHKICLADQESNVVSIYSATGVAWYYIISAYNKKFKLPRAKHNKYASTLGVVGNGISLGLDNGTQNFGLTGTSISGDATAVGKNLNAYGTNTGTSLSAATNVTNDKTFGLTPDPDKSGIIALQDQDTDQYKYLYFYVGEFTQTALENTAGLNAELFNDKVDVGHEVIAFQAPTAGNNYTWYRKYADGWVEQGGAFATVNSDYHNETVTLLIEMNSVGYSINVSTATGGNAYVPAISTKSTTGFTIVRLVNIAAYSATWRAEGMAA